MQGKKEHQPQLFAYVDVEKLIPTGHLLRRIDKVLDLSFIRSETKNLYCADNGRPSIDPEVFFRAQLLSYIYDLGGDRQLCEEVRVNIAYRWFVRLALEDEVFDHSSMTRIRDRLGEEVFKKVFEQIIEQCKKAGLVTARRLLHDASMIDADANLGSLVERKNDDPETKKPSHYKERYHDFATGKKQRKFANHTHVSSTDPDATIVSRAGGYRKLCYKGHYTCDAKSRVITDCHVTTGARHESQLLAERIDYQLERFGFETEAIAADKAYGNGPNYQYLRSKRITPYIPMVAANTAKEKIPRSKFAYDRKNDRYICPEQHFMLPFTVLPNGTKRYRVPGKLCLTCPRRQDCVSEKPSQKIRYIHRGEHQDEVDLIRKRQTTAYFKSKLRERQWKIEGLFGEAKQNHGLRRARYRGRQKVQIQAYLIATVQNLKRLATSLKFWLFIFLRRVFQGGVKNLV